MFDIHYLSCQFFCIWHGFIFEIRPKTGLFLNQRKNTHRFKQALEGVRRRDVLGFGAAAGTLTAAATVLLKYSDAPVNNKVLVRQLETDISTMQNLDLMNLIRDKNTPLPIKQKAAWELKRRVKSKAWEASKTELISYIWEIYIDYYINGHFEVDLVIGYNTNEELEMFFFHVLDPVLSIETLIDRLKKKQYPTETTNYLYWLIHNSYVSGHLDKIMVTKPDIAQFVYSVLKVAKYEVKNARLIFFKDSNEIEFNLSFENKDELKKADTIYTLRFANVPEYRKILERHIPTFKTILWSDADGRLKKEAISALRNQITL